MSVSVTINGTSYTIPTTGETGWGNNVTNWIQAASQHLLQKTGGAFTLTAEVNFGATYGLKSVYYKSSAGTVSTTGAIRLGASDLISWRNNANTQDLELSVDSSDRLNYNGNPVFGPNALSASKALESDSNGVIQSSSVTSTELGRLSGIGSSAVGVSDSQTLTNKTIDGDDNTVQDLALSSLKTELADASKFLVRDASGVVISNTKGVPTGDVVGTSDSQILTNKTIDADSNTITNIENADIKSGAAIARNKLASGTNDHVLINDGSGVMSSEAQLAISRGGTGQTTAVAAFDALAPTTTAGDIIVHNGTDNVRQAIGSDGQVLVVDTTLGNKLKWTTLQQGAKNYIVYNNFENNALTGWNEASVTWTSGAPSGAPTVSASAAASIALSVTSTTPLAGTYSLQMTGTIAQGQGFCTDVLTIDREDQAKVLQGSFYYEVTANPTNANFSGTSSNTLCVYIYDVTNSAWIQPAGVYNLVQSTGVGLCTFTFQTPASISQLRLFVFAANTASGSITVNFDDFALGPQKILSGAAISDYQDLGSISIGATTTPPTKGTTTIDKVLLKRVGDTANLIYEFYQTSAGTTGTGTYLFSLPSGLSFDSNKVVTSSGSILNGVRSATTPVGWGFAGQSNTTGANATVVLIPYNSTQFYAHVTSSQDNTGTGGASVDDPLSATIYPLNQANTGFKFFLEAPISGWSSNTVMSSDTDTRVVAGSFLMSTNQTVSSTSFTKILFDTVGRDTHGAFNLTLDRYEIPVTGFYQVSASAYLTLITSGDTYSIGIYRNGSLVRERLDTSSSTQIFATIDAQLIFCNAGDYIEIYIDSGTDNSYTVNSTSSVTFFTIARVNGPATIAASETVALAVNRITSAQTITAGSDQTIIFNNKKIDTHSSYSTSTGVWSCPAAGIYKFSSNVRILCGATAPSNVSTYFQVDGNTSKIYGRYASNDFINNGTYTINPTSIIRLNAGQTVKMIVGSVGQNININFAADPEGDVSAFFIQRLGI